MHILHVVRDLDATSGGISRSVPALAQAQATDARKPHVTVLFQDRGTPTTVPFRSIDDLDCTSDAHDADFVAIRSSGLKSLLAMRAGINQIHRQTPIDFIHLHGIWSPTLNVAAAFARHHSIPYTIAPRGMLSSWSLANKGTRKKLAWCLYQHRDLRKAEFVHVTSEQEAADVQTSVIGARTVILPNGCETGPATNANDWAILLDPKYSWCVALGRIHPVKGLDRLIEAWHLVRPVGWKLAIAGPDEAAHEADLKQLVQDWGLQDCVKFCGPIPAEQSRGFLSHAQLFVQASHSENFGIAIAEALSVGTPVIASQGTPWQEIVDRGCGWWVHNSIEGLANAIRVATSKSSQELAGMGKAGIGLIESKYSWSEMASRTLIAYRDAMRALV